MYFSDIDIASPVNYLSHNLKIMTLRLTLVTLPGKYINFLHTSIIKIETFRYFSGGR